MRKLLSLALLSLVACAGTDVGNPPRVELTGFDTSACKTRLGSPGDKGIQQVQDWMPDARLYNGLSCLLWEREDDTLHVRLVNHQDGCALNSQWEPRVHTHEAGIDVQLERSKCIDASCDGGCLYDLAFDVRLSETLGVLDALPLRLLGDSCHGPDPRVHQTLPLHLASQSSGAHCSYTFRDITAWSHTNPGDPRVPCGSLDNLQSRDCVNGVCTEVEPSRHLCLPACSSDADCQPSNVTACIDGVCQLSTSHAD